MVKKARPLLLKNKLITLAIVFSFPLFLTACSLGDLPVIGKYLGGGVEGEHKVASGDITVWGLWENTEVVNKLILKYNEKYPQVNVTYDDRSIIKPLVDYKERVFARAAETSGPDVVRVHVSWVPSLKNYLVPMPEGMMDEATFKDSFYPVAADNLISDGRVYGLPTYYDGLVLVYNKSHFAEIGQVDPPEVWEEFRRLALELTIRGEENSLVRAGAAIGTAVNIDFATDILGMMIYQTNASVPDALDTDAAVYALKYYANFYMEDGVWSAEMPEASVAFGQGKVSMIFVPVWNLLDILSNNPDMEIGVASLPQAFLESPVTWGTFWVDVVPKSSQNPSAAWSYIKFMAEEEQQLESYSESTKYRIYYGAPFSLVSLKQELLGNPYLKALLDSAPYAKTNEFAARAGNRRQEDALRKAISDVLSGKSAQEAMVEVKAEMMK